MWHRNRHRGAELEALAQPPTYPPLANERIYFVLPDRYANGDPTNDRGGASGGQSVTGYDPADIGWYHGGDLKGVTGVCADTRTGLARVKNLGFTAVWLAPVVVQQWVQGDSAAYHGYWGLDFTRVDPHFGTNADFADFVECAHSLKLKVYLDIVVNHTADVILLSGGSSYRTPEETPYRNCKGKPYSAQRYAGGKRFPCLSARYQPREPIVLPEKRGLKRPAWLNDVRRYHNRGDIEFSSCSLGCFEQGDFFGLDDVFTEQPFVVNGLAQVWADWIRAYKIDGFRVDTAKHVDRAFFHAWMPKIRAAAVPPEFPRSRSSARCSRPTLRHSRRSCASAACRTSSTSRCRTRSCATPEAPLARAASPRGWATTTTSGSPRASHQPLSPSSGTTTSDGLRSRSRSRAVPRARSSSHATCSATASSTSCAARQPSTTATR